jgi:cholesterol oxidase
VENVRYGPGSNLMGALATVLVRGDRSLVSRLGSVIGQTVRHPVRQFRLANLHRWSERGIIALVMQTADNSLTLSLRRRFGRDVLTSRQGHGEPNPSHLPQAHRAAEAIAARMQAATGVPTAARGSWPEVFGIPLTAHFLGGAAIGDSREAGVIDPYHRAYGYPTLFVVDGAAISANLGVNPSLSITAQAERAASLWPNKGENDIRPRQDEAYRRLDPIAPAHPVVPEGAPGELRWLPIESISEVAQEQSPGGDDAERSDAEERRKSPGGDDAERSDAEERRKSPGSVSSAG